MKRTKMTSSLLTVTAAVAGVAIGASLAMAAHPPITLYTYQEVSDQMGFTAKGMKAPVIVDHVAKQGMPYSPKQTCFGDQNGVACHGNATSTNPKLTKGYDDLAKHAYHAELGFNEWMDNSDNARFADTNGVQTGLAANKPWVQSHGHNGKW